MSTPEHFIDEVNEELRRDRLFKLMRKYGWIAILAVVLIVGGAAFNEWRHARAKAEAESRGDAILAAVQTADPQARRSALEAAAGTGDVRAVTEILAAVGDAAEAPEKAAETLMAVIRDASLPQVYRDLAALKLVTMPGNGLTAEARVDLMQALTAPGGAFRVLAEEQIALAEIEMGKTDAALQRLQALLVDDQATQALRRRATQLIVALGGNPEAA